MKRRALVIGSQTFGLLGVHNDVDAIAARLRARAFDVHEHVFADASRPGIDDGLDWLIRDSQPDDAAVIYYSGHGVQIINPRAGEPGQPAVYHSLVPTDWTRDGFHGFLDLELSVRLAELTAVTRNVSVILDCCHSGRMWRGSLEDEPVVRALEPTKVEGFVDYLATTLPGLDRSRLHAERNPDAVRLLACEPDQSAFEAMLSFSARRQRMGLMTATLCAALDDLFGSRVSWHALSMLVREEVTRRHGDQRPQVEGPGQRYLFEQAVAERGGAVPYFVADDRHALRANRLLGAEPGASYAIMPRGASTYAADEIVAKATVSEVSGARAYIDVEPANAELSDGMLAYPVHAPLARHAVCVLGPEDATAPLRELIDSSRFVRVASPEEPGLIELRHDGQLHLCVKGAAVAVPEPDDEVGRGRTLDRLETWARAEALRVMNSHGHPLKFEVEWGRVEVGEKVAMQAGDEFFEEDCLYVEVRNTSARPLFFSILDIGVGGAISLLTGDKTGRLLGPGAGYVLGMDLGQGGLACGWPAGVPRERPLPETLVVIAATERHDMTALETGAKSDMSEPETQLEQLFAQLGGGGARDFEAARRESGDYTIERISFMTNPRRR